LQRGTDLGQPVIHGPSLSVSVNDQNIEIRVDREHAHKAGLDSAAWWRIHASELWRNHVERHIVSMREGRDMSPKWLIRRSVGEHERPRVDQSSIEI